VDLRYAVGLEHGSSFKNLGIITATLYNFTALFQPRQSPSFVKSPETLANLVQKITISVQELPEAECQQYTRQLQMTEGLLALVANVARMSLDLLSAICKVSSFSIGH